MGGTSKQVTKLNMLMIGLDGAGKTTLMYKMRLKKASPQFEPTKACNYEIISQAFRNLSFRISTWDLSGRSDLRELWPYFYENIPFQVLFFVVHASHRNRMREAKTEYHRLANESKLLECTKLVIVNMDSTDQVNSMSVDEVRDRLELDTHISVVEVNAKTSDGMVSIYNHLYSTVKEH